mgnify:CR=1 FL=1
MRPLVRPLTRHGKEWQVVLRSGRVEYSSTCYAKAVGVHDYLEMRAEALKAKHAEEAKRFAKTK